MLMEPINKLVQIDRTVEQIQRQLTSDYFSFIRVGGGEHNLAASRRFQINPEKAICDLQAFSGYYDLENKQSNLEKFMDLYESNVRDSSMLFAAGEFLNWFRTDGSDTKPIVSWLQLNRLHDFSVIEAMYRLSEWFPLLANKKILVVSPFEHSIKMQYGKRLFSFDYPKFEQLHIVKSPITFNSKRFSCSLPNGNMFETADLLIEKIKSIDFDIALLGCGAYSMPIAHELKNMRKSHMILGGMLQMIFGIKGGRYDTPFFNGLMNENWILPLVDDRPMDEKFFFHRSDGLGAYF